VLHIPILRHGEPYRSLDIARTVHHRTREPFVEISQANVGLIRRDLLQQDEARTVLAQYTSRELLAICRKASDNFLTGTLPVGGDEQSPEDYVKQLSATTGMPHNMVRRNMSKIAGVLAEMESVLSGLSRNLDFSVLDSGHGAAHGHALSYFPRTNALGVVLPNNSPGVHSLWIPAFALKIPLVLKPGSAEPWTPYRIIQSLVKAGAPKAAFSFYPADHAGGGETLRSCGRGMVFGDVGSTKIWQNDPRVEIHGPGYSKVVIGEDEIENWERHLDVIVRSIVENGGRSCVNASGVWVPRYADQIAQALAERLAKIAPLPADDDRAQIAPFVDSGVAKRISAMIDRDRNEPGVRELTEELRGVPRLAEFQGCSYLLPTVVRCDSPDHPLANREFLFPFASVIEAPQAQMPEVLGPTLVLTAITSDENFQARLLRSPHIGRLNFGPISTIQISWDQPHEGNLFDHLYARRAFQSAYATVA
jgi:acyl-CoA reductase-like NAD-dependent aldehyde dehydrogenase